MISMHATIELHLFKICKINILAYYEVVILTVF